MRPVSAVAKLMTSGGCPSINLIISSWYPPPPPLAGSTFPELADLVGADLFAGSAIWRWPEITTSVLRIVYTLGPSRYGTLGNYLKGPLVPTILGFDPLFQFMHDEDAARAIALAAARSIRGVYNVAGPQPVPISELCRRTGRIVVPMPEFAFSRAVGRIGFPKLPRDSTNHIKYPVVVDDGAFRKATGYAHHFDEVQTMESFRWA